MFSKLYFSGGKGEAVGRGGRGAAGEAKASTQNQDAEERWGHI